MFNKFSETDFNCFHANFTLYKNLNRVIMKAALILVPTAYKMLNQTRPFPIVSFFQRMVFFTWMEKSKIQRKDLGDLQILMKSEKCFVIVKWYRYSARCQWIVWLGQITEMTRLSPATIICTYRINISIQGYFICMQIISFITVKPLHSIAEQYETYWLKKC